MKYATSCSCRTLGTTIKKPPKLLNLKPMEGKKNMDTIMSKKEMKEFLIEEGFPYEDGEDDHRMNIEEIKLCFGIKNKIHFNTCKEYPYSSIAWVNKHYNSTGKLLLIRISTHTLKKVIKGKNDGTEFDLLVFKYKRSGNTSYNNQYDEYHITAHNELASYGEPDEPEYEYEKDNEQDYDRDTFDALTDGQYGDYDEWVERDGDFDNLSDRMGY